MIFKFISVLFCSGFRKHEERRKGNSGEAGGVRPSTDQSQRAFPYAFVTRKRQAIQGLSFKDVDQSFLSTNFNALSCDRKFRTEI